MTSKFLPNRCILDNLKGCGADIYDFAVDGGAVGTIELDLAIPDNSIITGAYVDVLTDPASAGSATIALGLNTNTDLLGPTAIASVTGVLNLMPGIADLPIEQFKLTAERKPKVTIAAAALTAGKMAIYLDWIGPFDDIQAINTNPA